MKTSVSAIAVFLLLAALPAWSFESGAFQFRDDFGSEPLADCALNYYYYIPCPTASWFRCFTFEEGDVVGAWFHIGDISMGGYGACDPTTCFSLENIRILDYTGYGCIYCTAARMEVAVYCSDENGAPVGPQLWSSGPQFFGTGWVNIPVYPSLCVSRCCMDPGPPMSDPRILVTWTYLHDVGGCCPAQLYADNIGTPVTYGCDMHDVGCLAALYPRPYNSHYATIHSGYYGNGGLNYIPPIWLKDAEDTTPDGTQYGYCELAWRIYLSCFGPTVAEPSTWGGIKSMYR